MFPVKIVEMPERKLVGNQLITTVASANFHLVWQKFMPNRHLIKHVRSNEFFSVSTYEPGMLWKDYSIHVPFYKWASVEVDHFEEIPDGMETLIIPAGKYGVFKYKGSSANFASTWLWFIQQWLPSAGYQMDERPNFEIIPPGYKPNDENAEEEIWMPIRLL